MVYINQCQFFDKKSMNFIRKNPNKILFYYKCLRICQSSVSYIYLMVSLRKIYRDFIDFNFDIDVKILLFIFFDIFRQFIFID